MVLKQVFAAIICAAVLAWNGLSMADEYRPDEFLGLDLSSAVLSPKPLGPASEFVHIPLEAKADRGSERASAQAQHVTHPKIHVARARAEQPRSAARVRLARH